MAEQQYVSTSSEEKFNVVAKAIKTAAEMVHCYNIFQAKTKKIDDYTIEIMWDSTYSGQFILSYGDYEKTIVVESLF